MKTTLIALLTFFAGTCFGSGLAFHIAAIGIQHMDLDVIANRAVKDVASVYEDQLNKSGYFNKFEQELSKCSKSNANLRARILSWEKAKAKISDLCRENPEGCVIR